MADVQKVVNAKCERVRELFEMNRHQQAERLRVRDIMNNRRALLALLGKTIKDPDQRLPIANLMQRADTVLGQKLGRRPDVKVDPPATSDTDLAHRKADKRARIVTWLDDECELDALLPQVGRWVPGYGFTLGVVKQGPGRSRGADGQRQPVAMIELRDPVKTFPGQYGHGQNPHDVAVCEVISRQKLLAMYPQHKAKLQKGYEQGPGGAVMLDSMVAGSGPSWSNQSGDGVEVYEYLDERGCWWLVPESNLLLSFVPNVVKDDVPFRLVKRFAFDELVGQYDSAIGVMANMARLALLSTIAVEDAVMSETNIIGDLKGDEYRRGRNSVNQFTPGTQIEKMNSRVPFEAFQQIDRMERQLRLIAGHSSQSDGESDLSFATGRGLQELAQSAGIEMREYQTSFGRWVRDMDRLRLDFMEAAYPNRVFTIGGVHGGTPFAEKMTPSADIKGDHVTRRVYGAMAGFDDATKIITGLQLVQGKVIDIDTLRENLDGLENHQKIAERIVASDMQEVALETLKGMAAQGDERAMQAAIGLLPAGKMKALFEEIFLSEEEEPVAEEPVVAPAGMPPDVTTVMSRLTEQGGTGGLQTVGRVA